MDNNENTGLYLSLNDCAVIYPRFKGSESFLSEGERMVLLKIEKILYESFSIREIEDLLDRGSAKPDAPRREG